MRSKALSIDCWGTLAFRKSREENRLTRTYTEKKTEKKGKSDASQKSRATYVSKEGRRELVL